MTGQATDNDEPTEDADCGFTLIELLVAMGLFAVLGSILLGLGISTSNIANQTRQLSTVGDESRLGMERMTRELRETAKIADVVLPDSSHPADKTSFKLWADFNSNGCIDPAAADPEELTYTYDPSTEYLTLTASIDGQPRTERLLATKVSSFDLQLNSSAWQYDANNNGTTTWEEVNDSSIGDQNRASFTDTELEYIDLIGLSITTTDNSQNVDYTANVDLRNQNPDNQIGLCP